MGPGDPALCNCLPPRPKPMLVGPLSLTGTSPKVATSLKDSGMGLANRRYPMTGRWVVKD